jgi:hypothetical protein
MMARDINQNHFGGIMLLVFKSMTLMWENISTKVSHVPTILHIALIDKIT